MMKPFRFLILLLIISSCTNENTTISNAQELVEKGKLDEADKLLNNLSGDFLQDPEYHILKGRILTAKNDYNGALYHYEEIFSMGMTEPSTYSNAGDAAYKLGDSTKALNYFYEAYRLDSTLEQINYNLGIIWWQYYDHYEHAIKYFKREIDLNPQSRSLSALGQVYLNILEYDSAFHYFEQSLKIDRSNIVTNVVLGYAYLEVDSPLKAIEHFEIASEREPANNEFIYFLALSKYLSRSNIDFCPEIQKIIGTEYELFELHEDSVYAEMKSSCDF